MDVSILGRIGYDLYAEEHGLDLKDVPRFSRYLGGSSANMAVGLSRLGLRAGIISCLGTDALSRYLLEYLEEEGVDVSRVATRPGYLPSLCLTEVSPPDRFPQVFYRVDPADAQVEVGPSERGLILGTRLFVTNGTSLCASPSREATFRAMEWGREAGVRVAFDVDFRAMSWRSPEEAGLYARLALPLIDILIGNPEELQLVAGRRDLNEAAGRLRELGAPMLVAKLGDRGVRVYEGSRGWYLPPYPVAVLSTIGAGDGFASGFLYGLVSGRSLPESLKLGNAAAAIVVGRLMCSEAMPTLDEVENLIRRHPDVEVEESPL
jgi:5-dehydro-2-deoxygluconokinase